MIFFWFTLVFFEKMATFENHNSKVTYKKQEKQKKLFEELANTDLETNEFKNIKKYLKNH